MRLTVPGADLHHNLLHCQGERGSAGNGAGAAGGGINGDAVIARWCSQTLAGATAAVAAARCQPQRGKSQRDYQTQQAHTPR